MRKYTFLPAILLILVISSCTGLSRIEIENLDRTPFEPLMLEPDLESNELRIDLIRQSFDNKINDTTTVREDTDYHPVGFDLGNGMFFDLNDNLSFRLDYLLGITDQDCWTVEQTAKRKQQRADCIYTLCNDTLTIAYPPRRREYYQNHRVYEEGTVSVMWHNRQQYAVDFNDESTVYRHKRRKLDILRKEDVNRYSLKKGFWKENFELQENRLLLKKAYLIELSDDHKKIRVISPGWLSNRLLYTMEKSDNTIYIYDRHFRGKKIVFTDSGLSVYQGKTFITGWKL